MGSFAFNLKPQQKTLDVMVEGTFTPQNANDFIADYQINIAKINPAEFALVFDATNLKVTSQEMLPMLESCMQLYKQTGFAKVVMGIGNNPVLRMQIRRIANKAGLDNCEIK